MRGDTSKPKGRVLFWLDGRRYHGSHADGFGNFLHVHEVRVEDISASLAAVAAELHRGLTSVKEEAKASLARSVRYGAPACMPRVIHDVGSKLTDPPDVGFTLKLNNLSKMPLPVFGPGGTAATSLILTMAGPIAVLPSPDGGVRIFFSEETVDAASLPKVRAALTSI